MRKCLSFNEAEIPEEEISEAAEALAKEKESVEKFLAEHVDMACEDCLSASAEADELISKLETPGCHEEPGEELTPTVAEMTPDKPPLSPTLTLSPNVAFKPPKVNRPAEASQPRSTAAKSAPKKKPTSKENRDPNKGKDDKKKKAPAEIEQKPDGKNLPADELDPAEEPPAKVARRKRTAETVGETPSGSSEVKKPKGTKKKPNKCDKDDKGKDTTKGTKDGKGKNTTKGAKDDKGKDTANPESEKDKETPKDTDQEKKNDKVKVYING